MSMTTFKEIVDLAHTTLYQNYKLDNLLRKDEKIFYQFLYSMLLNSTNMFNGVLEDLSFKEISMLNEETLTEEINYEFNRNLSNKEIYILALGLAINVFKRELDDVSIYGNHLSAKEFKEVGNAQNLKARQERLICMQEELDQEITSYQLNSINSSGMGYFGGYVIC